MKEGQRIAADGRDEGAFKGAGARKLDSQPLWMLEVFTAFIHGGRAELWLADRVRSSS